MGGPQAARGEDPPEHELSQMDKVIRLGLELSAEQRKAVIHRLKESLALQVVRGDITQLPVEGILTAVNSQGTWGAARVTHDRISLVSNSFPRSVDGAIQRAAGLQFHQQAIPLMNQPEGTALVTHAQQSHHGHFQAVVFVLDDLGLPLGQLVNSGLTAADQAGLKTLAIPALRTGVTRRAPGTPAQKIEQIVSAVRGFLPGAQNLEEVYLVTMNAETEALIRESLTRPVGTTSVSVQIGDITRVPCQALVTPVNSEGMWAGGVDRAIMSVAGTQFHEQARPLLGAAEGTTVVAHTQSPHPGKFESVVFVVDDLGIPLDQLLTAGLQAAYQAGLTRLTVPAMRTGVMFAAGGPVEEKVAQMVRAARAFPAALDVRFVVYGDPRLVELFEQELRLD